MSHDGTQGDREDHEMHGRATRRDERVEEASIESFPASDPPAYTPSRSGDVDREVHLGTGVDGVAETQDLQSDLRLWASRFCDALSGKGEVPLSELIAEDVVWRAGDGQLLVGRDAVAEWQRMHVGKHGTLRHQLVDVRGDEQAVIIESEVARGSRATSHEAASIRLRGGLATRVQLYGAVYDG